MSVEEVEEVGVVLGGGECGREERWVWLRWWLWWVEDQWWWFCY